MSARDRKFFQQGVNMYVKAMQYASDVIDLEPQFFTLGIPAAATPNKYANAIPVDGPANTLIPMSPVAITDAVYGRTITVTPSAVPGNNNVIDINGQDYLGQPMTERFTGSAAANTIITGKKAFYRIISIKIITPTTTAGITYQLGCDSRLGLPYKGVISFAHEAGALVLPVSITSPTVFTVPDLTDPATNITGDPRGTYQPIAAMNGVNKFDVEMFGDNTVNAAGNGGLMGIQHFAS
jgi:hypothetical protein